jgi:alginate O-acetyltransferase complex protein AlgI
MLFNSIEFVVFFVFSLSVLVVIKNRKFQHFYLLFASLFFFFYSSNYLITLLIFSIVLDFFMGKEIFNAKSKSKKKLYLIISLCGNLGLLGFFKYTNFGIAQINSFMMLFNIESQISLLEIILPIGISFYTFQTLSYTIDIYRGHLTPSKSLKEFAIFVSFFPQLVAGPIVRAKDFLPQLREKQNFSGLRQIIIDNKNLKFGITLMSFGFFKKMFFADHIAIMVDSIFANPIGLDSIQIIIGTIAFGIQLYCDFSGYSDIAIGAALILGFYIPKNFNKPFFATSPGNFWTRWHISLSSWVKDYIYLPLMFKRRKSILFVVFSLFFTMLIMGIWHGAGWNFIIFGVIQGLLVAGHRLLIHLFPQKKIKIFFKGKIGLPISILITQYFIFLSFIAFRVKNLDHLFYTIEKYILFDFNFDELVPFLFLYKTPLFLILLFISLHIISYKKNNLIEKIASYNLKYWTVIIAIVLFLIVFSFESNSEDFIYFRF